MKRKPWWDAPPPALRSSSVACMQPNLVLLELPSFELSPFLWSLPTTSPVEV